MILKYFHGFAIEFDSIPEQDKPCRELTLNNTESRALEKEIGNLILKGVIHEVDHVAGQFISNVFLREKKEPGKYRMVLNLISMSL